MTNVPSGSQHQVEDQIGLCGDLLPFDICPAAWLLSHYSEIKSPQNASQNMFKLIKNSSNIVESRGPYSQFVILLSLYMCVCVFLLQSEDQNTLFTSKVRTLWWGMGDIL